MAQQHINYGASPNDGTGDTLRVSQIKAESNFTELYANKVDKVVGKVLSDMNYTQAEKDQLAALVLAGGNVQSNFTEGNSASPAYILNKPVNTSDFNNDGDGIQAFVPDNPTAIPSARINGSWVTLSDASVPKIQFIADGIIATYDIVVLMTIKAVFWNSVLLDDSDWSQSANILTLNFTPALNDKIKPI
jgi:hypothetical protein